MLDNLNDFGRLERRGQIIVRKKFAWGATTVGSIVDDLGRGLDVLPMLLRHSRLGCCRTACSAIAPKAHRGARGETQRVTEK